MIPARWLIDMASRLLQTHRREWADAMQIEFTHISEPKEAARFALGCLWAALCERITIVKLIVASGRLGIGLVTIGYGALFASFLINGLTQSGLNNPYLGWLLPWQLAMASSHIAAGLFLIFWRPRSFISACVLACLPALGLTLFGALMSLSHPASYVWPFIPIAMFASAAALLWWIENHAARPVSL